jgi:hypothetical protein
MSLIRIKNSQLESSFKIKLNSNFPQLEFHNLKEKQQSVKFKNFMH